MQKKMLEVINVSKVFGGLRAVDDISLAVQHGDIYGVIGPNGAGKSTLFNVVAGVVKPTSGKVLFQERDVSVMPAFQKCRLGMGRTFQAAQSISHHTVFQNMLAAQFAAASTAGSWLRRKQTEAEKAALDELLERAQLTDLRDAYPGDLNNLELQKLSISMALVNNPKLLLLDEPSGGLIEAEVTELSHFLRNIHARGVTLVIIDHKMSLIMDLCSAVTVMSAGKWIASGSPEEVLANALVKEVYLGNG